MEEASTAHDAAAAAAMAATGTTHCERVPKRVQYQVETETTEMQRETEDECEPFFVDLKTLPPDQLQHLRKVGLLPPSSKPSTSPPGGGKSMVRADNLCGAKASIPFVPSVPGNQ